MRPSRLPLLWLAISAFSLVFWVADAGLWDPYEVTVAEFSRRIALNLLGGAGLFVPGADNSVPIRADLGRGELPFSSAALGFRLFGLSDWAGRLPLALWAVLGLVAIYWAVARLAGRRPAGYAAVVLATTPLYFLQARTLLGDAVTLSAFAIAWGGCSVAVLDRTASRRLRLTFGVLGALGLYAGFWCRGALVSVAVPALSVALSAFVTPSALDRLGRVLGMALLAVAGIAASFGFGAWAEVAESGGYSPLLGAAFLPGAELPTFDVVLLQFGHAAFPWSAALPLAFAAFSSRSPAREGAQLALCHSAMFALVLSVFVATLGAKSVGVAPFAAISAFAVLLALGFDELERLGRAAPRLGFVVAAVALVLAFDFHNMPEKSLAGFALANARLPETMREFAAHEFELVALLFAVLTALFLFESEVKGAQARAFVGADYRAQLRRLQSVWDGNLVFSLFVLETALVGFLALAAVSERGLPVPGFQAFGSVSRKLAAALAIAVPVLSILPVGLLAARDGARVLFRRARFLTRPRAVLALGAAGSLLLGASFFPALSAQLSPKDTFEHFRRLSAPGDLLAVMEQGSVALRYRAGSGLVQLSSARAAGEWLAAASTRPAQPAQPRRFLILGANELAAVSAAFRESSGRHLPIVDASSSELFLSVSELSAAERDQSPLARVLLAREPSPQHPLSAVLGSQLEVLGWDLFTQQGAPARFVTPGASYRLTLYYRVLARPSPNWKTFVHVDGLQRRFNADHPTLGGAYPIELWRPGDLLADSAEFELEPNFSAGVYQLRVGLYDGERRLPVSRGLHEQDRVVAGTIEVR